MSGTLRCAVTWRLQTVLPDLVEYLERLPEPRLRTVAEAVVIAALRAAGLSEVRVERALEALRARAYGDSEQRASVEALADELDEAAWAVQERMDAGEPNEAEYSAAFRRARAAASLWFALDSDPLAAALEASYEAQAAADEATVRREIAAAS